MNKIVLSDDAIFSRISHHHDYKFAGGMAEGNGTVNGNAFAGGEEPGAGFENGAGLGGGETDTGEVYHG